jgi:EAL domain-containing protein (putative c-di-GMP-specific phosphodiesterase class I)
MDEILGGTVLETAYQPIIDLQGDGAEPFAFEALTRGIGGWFRCGVVPLLQYAARRGRLAELNETALARALDSAPLLPPSALLFLNVDPIAFDAGSLPAAVRQAAARAAIPCTRIVLEITERSAFAEDGRGMAAFDELREMGIRFALDDHASAYSHLAVINHIRPTFMKISATFGTEFERDPTRRRIVRHIVGLAAEFGCRTILEGVEAEPTIAAAAEAGVHYLQGYHLGRPLPVTHWAEVYSGQRPAAGA